MNINSEIVVIGGGAAGMCAAIVAARMGGEVTLLEQNTELGKKILATGNGRCNYTNMDMDREYFYSSTSQIIEPRKISFDDSSIKDIVEGTGEYTCGPDFLEGFLEDFPTDRILKFFSDLGISPRERDGYVYPFNDQATAIREALAGELFRLGVKVVCGCSVDSISIDESQYTINTKQGIYTTNKCILATGGNSGLSPKTEHRGYDLIANTKHHLVPMIPALTGLKCEERFFKRLSGVRSDATVSIYIDGKNLGSDTGEVQLTDYGISGIPVFQISRFAGLGLQQEKEVTATLDFVPHMNMEEFIEFLTHRKELFEGSKFKLFLNGLFKEKLGLFLMEESGFTLSTQVSDITKEELKNFGKICKNLTVKVIGINDYSKSQVTAGGVPLTEIADTFESKLHKGLYLVGEVLDVDGICGGYNLHFAWGSGIHAGLHATIQHR